MRTLTLAVAGVLLAGTALAGDAVELQARGVQIYACSQTEGGDAWRLQAPEATLLDVHGQVAAHHFAGPSWQASDGSIVVGEVLASSSGEPGSVPWLVLRAKSHSGEGAFASVTYIVRSHTTGGVAPAGGCDKAHLSAQARIDYSATYTFFSGPAAAKP